MTLRDRCEAILALIDEAVGAADIGKSRPPALLPARTDQTPPAARPVAPEVQR